MSSTLHNIETATQRASVASENHKKSLERETSASENSNIMADRRFATLRRFEGLQETYAAKTELISKKHQLLSEEIEKNNATLEMYARTQAVAYSEEVQTRIDNLTEKQAKLNLQYEQSEIALKRATIAQEYAINRVAYATVSTNDAMSGLVQGVSRIPGPLGQIGAVGARAMQQIQAGARGSQAAFVAMNAAISLGVSLIIQLAVGAWNKHKQAQEEANAEMANYNKELKQSESGVSDLIKNLNNLNNRMGKMSLGSLNHELESMRFGFTDMQFYANEALIAFEELVELSKAAEASRNLEQMHNNLRFINNLMPNLNMQMDIFGTIQDAEIERVGRLITLYEELANAKADAIYYEARMRKIAETESDAEIAMVLMESELARLSTVQTQRAAKWYETGWAKNIGNVVTLGAGAVFPSAVGFSPFYEEYQRTQSHLPTASEVELLRLQTQLSLDRAMETAGLTGGMYAEARGGFLAAESRVRELEHELRSGGIDVEEMYRRAGLSLSDLYGDVITNTSSGGALRTSNVTPISFRDEDIRMLHDIAMRDQVVVYQQITPQLAVRIDTIQETTDIEQVLNVLADGIEEACQSNLRIAEVA
jgi:hypothetical protein